MFFKFNTKLIGFLIWLMIFFFVLLHKAHEVGLYQFDFPVKLNRAYGYISLFFSSFAINSTIRVLWTITPLHNFLFLSLFITATV